MQSLGVKRHVPALTGLRAIAALSVLIAHAWAVVQFTDYPEFANFATPLAFVGMSLFFTLSGFLMVWNYAEAFDKNRFGGALRDFAVARFARLYPLFAFFFVIAIVTLPQDSLLTVWPDLPWFLVLLQSWIPTSRHGITVYSISDLAHSWSISTECFFYLAFPAIVLMTRARAPGWCALRCVIWTAFAVAGLYGLYCFNAAQWLAPTLKPEEASLWFAYLSPYTRIGEFVLGALACRFYRSIESKPLDRREELLATSLTILCLIWLTGEIIWWAPVSLYDFSSFADFLRLNFMNAPILCFLIFATCRYDNLWSRALSCAPLVLIGEASYSIYLLYPFVVFHFLRGVATLSLISVIEWVARMLVCILYMTALGYGLYRIIEVPSRRWLRATLARKTSAADKLQDHLPGNPPDGAAAAEAGSTH